MRSIRSAVVATWLLAGLIHETHAAAIITIDQDSCGQWVSLRAAGPSAKRTQIEAWALGFVSGWSVADSLSSDPVKGEDAAAIFTWMDSYCGQHPLENVPKASTKLLEALEGRAANSK